MKEDTRLCGIGILLSHTDLQNGDKKSSCTLHVSCFILYRAHVGLNLWEKIVTKRRDPQGQIQGQCKGQAVILSYFYTYIKNNTIFGVLDAISFPITQ